MTGRTACAGGAGTLVLGDPAGPAAAVRVVGVVAAVVGAFLGVVVGLFAVGVQDRWRPDVVAPLLAAGGWALVTPLFAGDGGAVPEALLLFGLLPGLLGTVAAWRFGRVLRRG